MGKRWWNKVTGVTKAKRAIAKATGVPTTRGGRQRKVGRMMGCSVLISFGLAAAASAGLLAATRLAAAGDKPATEDRKPDPADKAIGDAVAALKVQLENTKDDAERKKLAAAVAGLEAITKKPPRNDNHKLLDFADNPKAYSGQTLTFLVRLPVLKPGSVPLNEGNPYDYEFHGVAGDPQAKVTLTVYCDANVLKSAPAVGSGDPVLITFVAGGKLRGGNKMVEVKRP